MVKIRNDVDFFDACSSSYGYNELATNPAGIQMQRLYKILRTSLKFYYSHPIDMENSFVYPVNEKRCWWKDSFDLNPYGLTWSQGLIVLQAVYADCPLLYFSDLYKTGGNIDVPTINPIVDSEFIRGDFRVFYSQKIEEEIKNTVQSLNKSLSCREASKGIYDIIKNKATYDRNKGIASHTTYVDIPSHSILNYVRNRSAVCLGFARTYQAILNYISIPTISASCMTNNGYHAINFTYWEDEKKWALIDTTVGASSKSDNGFDIPPSNRNYIQSYRNDCNLECYKTMPEFRDIWKNYLNS